MAAPSSSSPSLPTTALLREWLASCSASAPTSQDPGRTPWWRHSRSAPAVIDTTAEPPPPAPPKLNIVMMVIGSRGDVQPFLAVAKKLGKEGHRVRLATHGVFRGFVQEQGVEFFDVGGDPEALMRFMVKNPGLVPGMETIREGGITERREQMLEMFQRFWLACISPSSPGDSPFVADAIIANPPSFAHVHCAERLGVPLHLLFTFPYSPTNTMPHPLAPELGSEYANAITYPMVEMLIWQGLGDLVNRFREKTLCLEPVATLWAPGMISRLKVPYSYMWSPALIPKPVDWGDHIDITGFVFLDHKKDYEPSAELKSFLAAGPPPIYIGFGSIIIDDSDRLTAIIFSAIATTGVRALVSVGWGGLGGGDSAVPENIFILENTPHDWLFPRVSAVVHHGGAGTTAIGLLHGKPTMVVPFFGDQQFWGDMIHNAGAGPQPVPHKELTAQNLADGITVLLGKSCRDAAQRISQKIKNEDGDGATNAVKSFYRGLAELSQRGRRGLGHRGMVYGEGGPMGPGEGKWGVGGPGMHCNILEERVAVWLVRKTRVRVSALAASWLVEKRLLKWKDLRLLRHTEWNDFDGPGEPVSGGLSALFSSVYGVAKGVVGVPYTLFRGAGRGEESGASIATAAIGKPTDGEEQEAAVVAAKEEGRRSHPRTRAFAHAVRKPLDKTARAPLDVTLAIAQGLHNAPRLYGDEVRRPPRITGFHSGMRAAGKGLVLGFYDGFEGLVLLPIQQARKGAEKGRGGIGSGDGDAGAGVGGKGYLGGGAKGAVLGGLGGAVMGIGMGLGGVVLKTQAGLFGVVAFSGRGVLREMGKKRERKVLLAVMEARRKQGERELRLLRGSEMPPSAIRRGWRGWWGRGKRVDTRMEDELDVKMWEGWKGIVEARRRRGERKFFGRRERKRERERKEKAIEG